MTKPFSITVGVVGVVAPAAHCVRLLLDDLRRIKDAPDEVKTLTGELDTINGILESLDKLPKEQWESLGETIPTLTEKASKLCGDSCTKFRDDLRRWTQHGCHGEGSMVRLSHGPAKYSEETVDSKLKREERERKLSLCGYKYRRRLVRAHRSERRLSLVWIRAVNWLGPRGSSCGSCALGAQ